jgi:hypothetical protein
MRDWCRPDASSNLSYRHTGWLAWQLTSDSLLPARTEPLDRCGDSLCHHQPAFRGRELKLLLPVYDRARFQQNRWHVRSVKHDKVIVTVNAGFRID